MERSVFLDLACENFESGSICEGMKNSWELQNGNLKILRGEDERHGRYSVFFTEALWLLSEENFFEVREALSQELRSLFSEVIRSPKNEKKSLLVAGLGNPKMTADALGSEVVDRIIITRKINDSSEGGTNISISAIATGVLGTTGIETVEHLRALCEQIHPSAVLAVDALSAKRRERLGATVQIATDGLSPGAGIKQPQTKLCQSTLGVPVISLGVPTVLPSSAILFEAFASLGVEKHEEAKALLEREEDFFIMPKESDLLLQSAALLLSSAINHACERL